MLVPSARVGSPMSVFRKVINTLQFSLKMNKMVITPLLCIFLNEMVMAKSPLSKPHVTHDLGLLVTLCHSWWQPTVLVSALLSASLDHGHTALRNSLLPIQKDSQTLWIEDPLIPRGRLLRSAWQNFWISALRLTMPGSMLALCCTTLSRGRLLAKEFFLINKLPRYWHRL